MLISHDGQLVSDISSLLNNNAYNDVTIMLNNGVKLEANKLVLSARSKFFAHLIQGKNTVQTEIKLDISALKGSLYLIVKYLYTGKMDLRFLSLGDLLDLLNLTKWMEMDLFSLVEGHIIKSVDDCKFNTTSLLKQATLLEEEMWYLSYYRSIKKIGIELTNQRSTFRQITPSILQKYELTKEWLQK